MKPYLLILVLFGLSLSGHAQKSKVLAVKQMIDAGKYEEAREEIELAVGNKKTANWHRTHYTRGLLCQTAYEVGVRKNETKLIKLYPDQLYVAYDSYERALELDVRGRLHTSIRNNYFLLSNDFSSLGEQLFRKQAYPEALRAFEHALLIADSELVSARTDTNLVYNAALAAYESSQWNKAIGYLTGLHENAHSTTSSLLLSLACFNAGDTLRSEEVLLEALDLYHYEEPVVMYLVNNLVDRGRSEAAIDILNMAVENKPENFRFLWARGLVYQKSGQNDKGIENFLLAINIAPDEPELCYHLGLSYYNAGVELRKSALLIADNEQYREARKQYLEKFRKAVRWLERSNELDPQKEETVNRLHLLYDQLQINRE